MMKRTSFFSVLVLKVFVGHHRTINFTFFGISGSCRDLDNCDIERLALETNGDHYFVSEITPKYCISDSFVDYEGCSISSKGFLPTVVDKMVICIKFSHSSPF